MNLSFVEVPTIPNIVTATVKWSDALEKGLLPEERKLVGKSWAKKRASDFILGRAAAHKACKRLGIESVPVLKADDGSPVWPDDLIGSISHRQDIGVAAVSLRGHYRGLGVDVEEISDRHLKVLSKIATAEEESWIKRENNPQLAATALFASKEALYKTLAPICKRYIGFHEVVLSGSLESRRFSTTFSKPLIEDLGCRLEVQTVVSWNESFLIALTYAI